MIKRVFLIGFRTTGKSTFGKILAENLGLSFFDMDFLIKEQAGQELNVLTNNGSDWVKFREIENDVLKELTKAERAVISCGGGVGVNDVINKETKKTFGQLNREVLKKSQDSIVILLTASDKIIEQRLQMLFGRKKIMPFLNQENSKSNISKKDLIEKQVVDSMSALQKRKKSYEEIADFEIDTSNFIFPKKLVNINAVIGDPIEHSLSPQMHNVGYKALGINKGNLLVPVKVKKEKLKRFIEAVRALRINGISVTVPHKETTIKYLDKVDETAKKIGAVNTVLNEGGKLIGYNTDWIGAIAALEKRTNLKGKKVAVFGAGGAARAIVFGLTKKGVKVKIFNRSVDRAKELAKEFNCSFGDIKEVGKIRDFDIIINATSIGMNEEKSPIDKNLIQKGQIVMDAVYTPKETTLLKNAKEKKAEVVYGYEMLLYQGVEQFKMYTGLDAPVEEMRKVLING